LNGKYFNELKGIFSKLDIDELIPRQYRLLQSLFSAENIPKKYPVFLKPEWGQNSNGINRVDNTTEFLQFVEASPNLKIPYIVQEAALEKKEFEIYYLRSPNDKDRYLFLSITEVINRSGESYPVNSIYNSSTIYSEVTASLAAEELEDVWQAVKDIGGFRMARVGVKADDLSLLLRKQFKIIEINLFLPMPLILLAENVSRTEKLSAIRKTMTFAAQLVKTIPQSEKGKWIFFRKMRAHYKTAL
jgi:D-alanine-D-alanine ligase-like ATP-grasp enzyme